VTQQRKRRNRKVDRQMARYTKAERIMGELELVAQSRVRWLDPIQEQLRQCPEAFHAGELIGQMCDRLKYSHDEVGDERCLPPAGAVIPPLV
jgi:hypothetical protein